MIARRFLSTAFLVLGSPAFVAGSPPAPVSETETQLLARIQREHKAVKKSLLEIRLSRLDLEEAIQAYDQGNLEQGARLLALFLNRINDSWQTLRGSGRDAVRDPRGFRDLDIALRRDARLLEDLEHRIPYDDRGPIEKAAREVDRVRTEVLEALFPGFHGTKPEPARPPAKTR